MSKHGVAGTIERGMSSCADHTKRTGMAGALSNDYGHWIDWATEMSKAHAQVRCDECGLWKIWLPSAEAKRINLQSAIDQKRFNKRYEKFWNDRELSQR